MGNSTKERPILFSGAMVRAILDGRKTQTRRVVKPKPFDTADLISMDSEDREIPKVQLFVENGTLRRNRLFGSSVEPCPYGVPGDRLWVRETWTQYNESTPADHAKANKAWESFTSGEKGIVDAALDLPTPSGSPRALYAADFDAKNVCWNWRPSIFMPRWASRITLEITDLRVQRLQDISEEDAQAEGAEDAMFSHRLGFEQLWDSINGKTHPWASNPWLWCLTFKRVTQ